MAAFHSQKVVEMDLPVLRIAIGTAYSTADFAHLAFHTFNLNLQLLFII